MLPVKRLIYILFFVTLISSVFMIYNINEEQSHSVNIVHEKTPTLPLMGAAQDLGVKTRKYVIVGDSKKELYGDIFKNAQTLLSDWKVTYDAVDNMTLQPEALINNEIIIFCDDSIAKYVDLKALGNYIAQGGKVIFAAGIAEGYEDSYLLPFMGIAEKSFRSQYNDFLFTNNFLPLQKQDAEYAGYNASTRVSLRESANVYIEDKTSGIPILFTHPFEKGECCVINGNLMADFNCCGLLSGSIALLEENLIYPVVGVRSVYLDNFPMVTYINDKRCMKLYGRTTEAFVRDVVWPVFQGISLRQNVPYTSSVLVGASSEKAFPEISKSLFITIGKFALQYNGELAYAVDTDETHSIYLNEDFVKEFEEIYKNYTVRSLMLNAPVAMNKVSQLFGNDIEAVRGYLASKVEQFRFASSETQFCFPLATFGNQMESGNLLECMSVIAAYGMVSHVFDVNGMVAQNDEVGMWDYDKKQVAIFEEEILSKTPYLEAKTHSQTKNDVSSFLSLEYSYETRENSIELRAKNFVQGQKFFLKTDKKLSGASGITYQEIGNQYYLLILQEPTAVIQLEAR